MPKVIDSFQGEYGFLSNFHPSPICFNNIEYPTVEHAFQAMKTEDPQMRTKIAAAATPGEAKRMGRNVRLRLDWEEKKIPIMKRLLELKFQIPSLRRSLKETGCAMLVEGNKWNDRFWGVCNGAGRNELGKLLMDIRRTI